MIETVLAVSARHLAPGRMDRWAKHGDHACYRACASSKNWLVAVPGEIDAAIPSDLAECMRLAKANGCDWIRFDEEIEPLSILPVHHQD